MDQIKLLKEPECWCGHNSIAAEPQPFKEIPDDHFQLSQKDCKELQEILERKGRPNEFGVPPPSTFVLRGDAKESQPKQRDFSAALDQHVTFMKQNREISRPIIDDLLRANNVRLFDLGSDL